MLVPPKVKVEELFWVVPLVGAIVIDPFTTKSIPAAPPRIAGLRHSPPAPVSMFPIYTFPFMVGVPLVVVNMKNLTEPGNTIFSILKSLTSINPFIL